MNLNRDLLKKGPELKLKRPAGLDKVTNVRVSNVLWPIAAILAVAVVAVPLLLSSSSSQTNVPLAQSPQSASSPNAPSIPAVSVSDTASTAKLKGPSRNPFTQLNSGSGGSGSSKSSKSSKSGSSSSSGSSSTSSSGSSGSSSSTPSGKETLPTKIKTTPPPPWGVLTPTETFRVSVSVSGSSGDENTINSLERLSTLPSRNDPLMIELGVLKGSKDVLFALLPGTAVSGSATCVPGPSDCQVVEIPVGKIETLKADTQEGWMAQGMFAVTGITKQKHKSTADARTARRVVNAFGHALLKQTASAALSLFEYLPNLGVLVDKRNLNVGGGS